MAWRLYRHLGLTGLTLQMNSIGCRVCRPAYLDVLKKYYTARAAGLCADCRARLERNPLRLLDCKQESCQPAAEAAPASTDHLCPECAAHFSGLKKHLDSLGFRSRSTAVWCAAWTTTPAPSSRYSRKRKRARAASAPGPL